MGMNENVDILVCHPDVRINKTLEAVFIQFEVMNPDTQEGTGKSHTVMMTMPDAMRLLRHMEHIQQKFCLPNPTIEIAMTEIPASKKEKLIVSMQRAQDAEAMVQAPIVKLKPEERRALLMLAQAGRRGIPEALMAAHFDVNLLAGMVHRDWVRVVVEPMPTGGKRIEVPRMVVTDTGRQDLR